MESSSQRTRQNRGGKKNRKNIFLKLTTLPNQNKVQLSHRSAETSKLLEKTETQEINRISSFDLILREGCVSPDPQKVLKKKNIPERWEGRRKREPEHFLEAAAPRTQ